MHHSWIMRGYATTTQRPTGQHVIAADRTEMLDIAEAGTIVVLLTMPRLGAVTAARRLTSAPPGRQPAIAPPRLTVGGFSRGQQDQPQVKLPMPCLPCLRDDGRKCTRRAKRDASDRRMLGPNATTGLPWAGAATPH